MDSSHAKDKYKATKLWNDAIRAFRNQMPVKNHRKHFKSFANTFTGAEAVDWLHGYLSAKTNGANSCDSSEDKNKQPMVLNPVTKEQTLALLNKFYGHGLFELAQQKLQEKAGTKWRVKDDGTMYRFSNLTPSKIARTPLALKNSGQTEANNTYADGNRTPTVKKLLSVRSAAAVTPISYRKLPETSVNASVKSKCLGDQQRTEKSNGDIAKCSFIDQLLAIGDSKDEPVHHHFKMEEKLAPSTAFSSRQSSIRLSIRKNVNFSEQNGLPHLQMVARQLSWEEVENVWKTLALSSLRQLLRLGDNAFSDSAFIVGQNIYHNAKYTTPRGVTRVFSKLDELPGWTLQAMKCLANWPWKNSELNWPCYPGFERDVFATVLDFFATQPEPLLPHEIKQLMLEVINRVEYLDVQQWDASHEELIQSPSAEFRSTADTYSKRSPSDDISVETEFGPRSPITHLVEREPRSRTSVAAAAINRKQDNVLSELRSELDANVRSLEEILSTLPGLVKSPRLMRQLKELKMKNGEKEAEKEENEFYEFHQGLRTPLRHDFVNSNDQFHVNEPPPYLNLPGARFSLASTITGSFSCSGSPPLITAGPSLSFFTRIGRQMACKALQLCLLFLPPRNRRWLQLLLRMMAKISVNYCLRLDKHNSLSNRSIVLEAFCDVIISGKRDCVSNATNGQSRMKLLSFILDAYNDVFSPPTDLTANVENRIREMQRAKISYGSSDQNSTTLAVKTDDQVAYCERISPKEYEQQATLSSRFALQTLLNAIADDKTLCGNEKKKRLKKFKDSYPDLFYQRFPNKASFESLIKSSTSSPNKKIENLTRSASTLSKLVSMKL